MDRRQYLIKLTHWYERTTRRISLDTLTSLGLVPGVYVPAPWLEWAEQLRADAKDESETQDAVRYG